MVPKLSTHQRQVPQASKRSSRPVAGNGESRHVMKTVLLDLDVGEPLGLQFRNANDTGWNKGDLVIDLLLRQVDL